MSENLGPALVTGASGFIGRHLVRALLRQNRKVIALRRRVDALTDLQCPSLQIISGDIQDRNSYQPHLGRQTTVFHLAAVRGMDGVPLEFFHHINETASFELARICVQACVAKFVYVSSAVVYGSSHGQPVSECRELSSEWREDPYIRSKVAALREMRKFVALGLPMVTVCPTIVFGPDENYHRNRVTSQIRRLLRSGIEMVVEGGNQSRDLVFVDDVVRGILLAEKRGAEGEEYILGGGSISHQQLNRLVLSLAGRTSWLRISIPSKIAMVAARFYERLRGHSEDSGYPVLVRRLISEWQFSSEKSRHSLGYTPTPPQEAFLKTVQFVLREIS